MLVYCRHLNTKELEGGVEVGGIGGGEMWGGADTGGGGEDEGFLEI